MTGTKKSGLVNLTLYKCDKMKFFNRACKIQ